MRTMIRRLEAWRREPGFLGAEAMLHSLSAASRRLATPNEHNGGFRHISVANRPAFPR